jgi:hypothetical protein
MSIVIFEQFVFMPFPDSLWLHWILVFQCSTVLDRLFFDFYWLQWF